MRGTDNKALGHTVEEEEEVEEPTSGCRAHGKPWRLVCGICNPLTAMVTTVTRLQDHLPEPTKYLQAQS